MSSLRIFVDFSMDPDTLALLKAGTSGHELVFPPKPVSSVLAKGDPDPQVANVDVAFGQPDPRAIQEAPALRWVHISSSGITRYDTPEFRAMSVGRNLLVTNSACVYNEACAAHVLSFMLAQARKLPAALATRAANATAEWRQLRATSTTLRGETVLILGYGAIGRRLRELLTPFGMNLLAYRRKARGDEGVRVVKQSELGHCLAEADHVINILPDSAETRGYFNQSRFAEIKPGATFYNIGRGATVDQSALATALRSGHLGAAWLDVTEPEPLPDDHPLWSQPNCFITPHVAGGHKGETMTLVRHFLANLERFMQGEPLLDRVM